MIQPPRMSGAELTDRRDHWLGRAACAGVNPEIFFPDHSSTTPEAKKVCASCPVIAHCLAYALKQDGITGIWGGKTERERRWMKWHTTA